MVGHRRYGAAASLAPKRGARGPGVAGGDGGADLGRDLRRADDVRADPAASRAMAQKAERSRY